MIATVVLGGGAGQAHAALSVSAPNQVAEGEDAVVTVSRGFLDLAPASATVTLVTGTASRPADVGDPAPAQVSFSGLDGAKTVRIPVPEDTLDEVDETFDVVVTDLSGSPVANSPAPLAIVDDDPPPTLTLAPGVGREGTPQTPGALVLPVNLSAVSGRAVTFRATLTEAAATATPPPAKLDEDLPAASRSVSGTIPAGSASVPLFIPVTGDFLDEGDESVVVSISQVTNGVLGTPVSRAVTITDDDVPTVAAGAVDLQEGSAGTTAFVFPVILTNPSTKPVEVVFGTADVTAAAGSDYQATLVRVRFEPLETRKDVVVPVLGDAVTEPDEAFVLETREIVGNAKTPPNPGLGIIRNDDAATVPPGLGGAPRVPAPTATGRLRLTALKGSKGRITARLTCPAAAGTCVGEVAFFTVPAKRSKVKQLRRERRLGVVRTSVAGGTAKTVSLRVKAADRKLVRRAKSVRVKGFATAVAADGKASVANATGTVKP